MSNIPAKKYKSRVRIAYFLAGKTGRWSNMKGVWIVEFCMNRKWLPLGDATGTTKFSSKKAAEKARDNAAAILAK